MIRSARFALSLLAAALLAACATGMDASYVGRLSGPDDVHTLAVGMAEFVSMELPAASSTVALDPTPPEQANNTLTPAFGAALRSHGFAMADATGGAAPSAHHLRYWVTPLDNGDLVRLSIDGRAEGARFFVRNTYGALQSGGPFTVRQLAASR